jgi:outer membrane protein OmpA-like peptidoglycan-associated protein
MSAGAVSIEKELSEHGKVDVYSIYFSFNSNTIREESQPTLKEISEVLRRHPDWKLRVDGHTDNIGSAPYNLDLSKRRAGSVRETLVKQYGVQAGRLLTGGYGASRPKDTNDTLEGRARNRRVELSKIG